MKSNILRFALTFICLSLYVTAKAYAADDNAVEVMTGASEPEVVETYTSTENPCITWYVRGVVGKPDNITAYVGTEEVSISESGLLGDEGGYAPRTLILVDNSVSMNKYKSKVRDILERLIWNHQNCEEFSLVTFDKEKQILVDFTDNYDDLRIAAENIKYKSQKTYLRNILYDEIKNLSSGNKNNYNRIVVFSDGTDDSILGITYEELIDLLTDDSTSCPIYTIGGTYKPSQYELDRLFALSRRSGSPYFLMDDYEDATEIADAIDSDGKGIRYFSFDLNPELRDGSNKTVSILLEDDAGEHFITHESRIQVASADELKELEKKRSKEADEADTANSEEPDEEVTDIAYETDEPVADDSDNLEEDSPADPENDITHPTTALGYITYYLSQNGVWLTLLLLVGLAAYVRFSGNERKKNKEAFVETEDAEDQDAEPDENKSITKGIVITNLRDAGVKYFIAVGQSSVIGRLRSRCDISFPDDRSMAARGAVIHVSSEKAELENLDTLRGSLVDGQMISGSVVLKNGSHIRIGNTNLRVTYE